MLSFLSRVKGRSRLLLLALGLLISFGPAARAADIDVLKTRLIADFQQQSVPSNSSIANWLSTQRADGSWPDVTYTDTNKGTWSPERHHYRLLKLAMVYNRPGNTYYHKANVLTSVRTGLAYYVNFQPRIHSANWWHNEIGEGLSLGPVLLLMGNELSATLVKNTAARLLNSPTICNGTTCTGANLVWVSTNVIYRGCAENNLSYVASGFKAIASTLVVGPGEGVQPDYSFHQHAAQLYNGGYGRDYIKLGSFWAAMGRGLTFAFSPVQVQVLAGLMLEGDAWMVRGQRFDYSVMGREITVPGHSALSAAVLAEAAGRVADAGSPRAAELRALAAYVSGGSTPVANGNRHYWRSDYQSHRRTGYFSSVRMHSVRTVGMELINTQGLRSFYLSYGANLLYRRGNEYEDIFPVWDWARLPGVTAEHSSKIPVYDRQNGLATFVGGVSEGQVGAAALDLQVRGSTLKGRKAWFFFDNAYLCLGAGLTATQPDPIYTSVNQCLRNGAVTVQSGSAAPVVVAPGQQVLKSPRWVHHDGVGYFFPGSPANVTLKNQAQTGAWKDIFGEGSATVLSKDVFSLWLDHGRNPVGGSYSYVVVPDVTPAQMAAAAATSSLRVLVNKPAVQAARDDAAGITEAAFYEAGNVELQPGRVLAVNQPCLVTVREQSGSVRVAVSNPRNEALTVAVTLPGHLQGTGATYSAATNSTQLSFALPTGNFAGQSLVRQFTLVTTPPVVSPPVASGNLVSGNVYRLVARHSGLALDVVNNSGKARALVQQYPINESKAQHWLLEQQADNSYTLTHDGTNQRLEVRRNGQANGDTVRQYPPNTSAAQRWVITPTDNGYYKLRHQGSTKYLDVTGGVGATQPKVRVQQWEYLGTANQQWRFELISTAAARVSNAVLSASSAATEPLLVYPNPATDQLQVRLPAPTVGGTGTLTLTDGLGRVVQSRRLPTGTQQVELDVRALPAGFYLLWVQQDGQAYSQRVSLSK